jgi:hypothetical protein
MVPANRVDAKWLGRSGNVVIAA